MHLRLPPKVSTSSRLFSSSSCIFSSSPRSSNSQKADSERSAGRIYSKGAVWQIKPAARDLLEKYSGIAPDRVDAHVVGLRDRAFEIKPFPCIAHLRFLALSLSQHPAYTEVLQRLKNGQTFLELGCCFGQEIRKLVHDGAPSSCLYGLDMVEDFVELGYELFLDKASLDAKFLIGDIVSPSSAKVHQHMKGRIDIVYASSFFHLFDLEKQIELAKQAVYLLRPQKGSVILGRQLGSVRPGIYPLQHLEEGLLYRHDEESFNRMWRRIGEETNSTWHVEATLDEEELGYQGNKNWGDPDMRRLRFAVYRQ